MKKSYLLSIGIISLFIYLYNSTYASFIPIKNVSGNNKCYYKITGNKADNSVYLKDWTETNCNSTIDLSTLDGGIPDGTYQLHLKADDMVILGDDKKYSDNTGTGKSNKYGITTWPSRTTSYKIDTKAPTCVLKEIRFLAGYSNNQYYNNGNFYYKSVGGNGQFELIIEADDNANGTEPNTSKLAKIEFPTILGAKPTTISYSPSKSGKVIVTGRYIWSGNNSDSGDILNNASREFCFDEAGNSSSLTTDSTTKLIIEDGGLIVAPITSLILVGDSIPPNVGGVAYNAMTNGIKYKTGNDGNGVESIIYNTNTSSTKYFAALNNRKIILPAFKDNGSGLKSFRVKIEKHDNKNFPIYFDLYERNLSTKDNRVTDLTDLEIIHNFSLVDLDINSFGYRNYSWNIETLNLAGNKVKDDEICDMVGNCISIPTPDFRVVANTPIIKTNTAILDLHNGGIKHNLNSTYDGNNIDKRSNLYDTHTTLVYFQDTYRNIITPVSGVKDIKFEIKFDNTLGCDQYYNPDSGDCVDFTFKNNNSILNGYSNPVVTEKKNFNYTLNNYNQFDSGILKIELKSRVPTKNEYRDINGNNLYGSLTAKLQLTDLTIKVDDKTGYFGVGENSTPLQIATTGNKPFYKWAPIINYNNLGAIYPLIEGQEKSIDIGKYITDSSRLNSYKLETKLGTNNFFLKFNNINLRDGNIRTGGYIPLGALYDGYYDILKNSSSLYGGSIYGYGIINLNSDIYNFTPKTIGGISGGNRNIAIYSKLNYLVGGKNVLLPSIQSGFNSFGPHEISDFLNNSNYNTNSLITFGEIDVRGITQTRNTLGGSSGSGATSTDNSTFQDFSNISLFDIKTQIKKNVEQLLAGSNKELGRTSGSSNITSFDFSTQGGLKLHNNQVIYFKDRDVNINCSGTCNISGKKTIIVENGNLFIASDMKYLDNNSILGIILIGNTDSGNTSQLRISEDITNGVGIVFSEGPILSVDSNNTKIYDGTNTTNRDLVNQLYWKGSFATRNTVGGAIKDGVGVCPYGTPDYKKPTCTIQKAQGYDLIYLRRYARVDRSYYSTVTTDPMGDGKIPLNIDKKPVKIAGGDIFSRYTGIKINGTLPRPTNNNLNAPLIIEYDSRIQTNPPLGFNN